MSQSEKLMLGKETYDFDLEFYWVRDFIWGELINVYWEEKEYNSVFIYLKYSYSKLSLKNSIRFNSSIT